MFTPAPPREGQLSRAAFRRERNSQGRSNGFCSAICPCAGCCGDPRRAGCAMKADHRGIANSGAMGRYRREPHAKPGTAGQQQWTRYVQFVEKLRQKGVPGVLEAVVRRVAAPIGRLQRRLTALRLLMQADYTAAFPHEGGTEIILPRGSAILGLPGLDRDLLISADSLRSARSEVVLRRTIFRLYSADHIALADADPDSPDKGRDRAEPSTLGTPT